MRLPPIELDDRRFQDLVSEARLRIDRACPEWTEHNVSDPGITLIELFAWMTEMTIYRLNRVPDKLHVALMELLGIELDGPTAAHTRLRFRLSAPADRPIEIPGGDTEVGTLRTATEESIVFQVDEDFAIPPAAPGGLRGPARRQVQGHRRRRRDGAAAGRRPAAVQRARRRSATRCTSASRRTSRAARPGLDRGLDGPRRRREPRGPAAALGGLPAATATGREAEVLEDLTGGFNYGSGTVEVQCPPRSADRAARRQAAALAALPDRRQDAQRRERRRTRTRRRSTRSPRRPVGALLGRRTRRRRGREMRRRERRHAGPDVPAPQRAGPQAGGRARRSRSGTRSPVTGSAGSCARTSSSRRASIATSRSTSSRARSSSARRSARPTAAGRSTGRCPPKGAVLRMSRYRHGGGRAGNVAAGTLLRRCAARSPASPRSPTPSRRTAASTPSRSSTRAPARGDGDPDPLPRGHRRGLRVPRRRGLAARRARRCVPPTNGGPVPLHILPHVYPADRQLRTTSSCPTTSCCRRSPSTSTRGA